ncbi:hypothetical protein [Prosthecobacter sp.]|uniref:hypothetical protein n=1 Tax=Prosthecobacter sp. TaxID=1965333 RepID=UPI0037852ADF
MKHALSSSRFAWLLALLLLPAAALHAADDAPAPAPDCQAVIMALFQKADVVKISGYVVDGIRYDIESIAADVSSREELEYLFLTEKPLYLGKEIPPHLGEYSSSRLNFIWVDVEQKEVGRAALLEGDRLLINGSLLFSLSPVPGEKNLRFLRKAANFATDLTFDTPADTPNYRRIVRGFFEKAASCKIKGYHTMSKEGMHMIDYITPDVAALRELERSFLHEKALFSYGTDSDKEIDPDKATDAATSTSHGISHYKFTWLDAKGAPVAYAELVDRELIGLNGRHYFSTNSKGRDGANITLWRSITRLVDPEAFNLRQPDYQAMIQDLFSKAASCSIEGSYAIEKILPYDVKFTASDTAALLALKEIFLFEKPRYKERTNGDPIHITSPSHLNFIWKDAQGKELGSVSLLNDDRLEFKSTHDVFQLVSQARGQHNITLLTRAARFALPRYFKTPAPPNYQDLVQGLFAKAVACRMKGYCTDVKTDTTHDVDFTASDSAALQALRQIFLAEKPRYLGLSSEAVSGSRGISSLHCFWTDAQGKELAHVVLEGENRLLFTATQDVFSTDPAVAGSETLPLLTRLAQLGGAQPKQAVKTE